MSLFRVSGGGIGAWLTDTTCEAVFERLARLDSDPLRGVQLNQLLVLAHEAPVSDGFFNYYWLEAPKSHPYAVKDLPEFREEWITGNAIQSLDHLAWGLYRLYVDALLYFGNVRTAFRTLRNHSLSDLRQFFFAKRIDSDAIKGRGPPLPLRQIEKEKRYLIAESACKSYGDSALEDSKLRSALVDAFHTFSQAGLSPISVRDLLERHLAEHLRADKDTLVFSASDILDRTVSSEADVLAHYTYVATRFRDTRADAVKNTQYYLSMITDLDVYVATSMRNPAHFVRMAEFCETVFNDPRLSAMNLRYFDPTLSAADGHEDKGLIECLMVKCAKALVYCRGDKESYGKDAEAAMALSLGHPVIFYCEKGGAQFYRDIHPLTRLIQFDTGVAVGAMVTDRLEDVVELLSRMFENRMSYRLERSRSGSLRLIETVTSSVVRLQTSDLLISETFWNHYHQERDKPALLLEPRSHSTASRTPRPVLRTVPPQAPEQSALALEPTESALPIAARAPSSSASTREHKPLVSTAVSSHAPASPMLQLSLEEIYNGIARAKTDSSTGNKRFAIFSAWKAQEGIDLSEAAKLLRFVEKTLSEHGARPAFVYKPGELSGWYREMSNGQLIGSNPK